MKKITIWVCHDMEERWHESMAAQCELEWVEHEHEQDLGDAEEFQHVQPDFCDLRADVDPYWPPRDLPDWFEVAEPDPALAGYEVTPYHQEASL